jgi:hypothetical protein
MDRRLFIVIAVVGFHVLGLWALQTGLLRDELEIAMALSGCRTLDEASAALWSRQSD